MEVPGIILIYDFNNMASGVTGIYLFYKIVVFCHYQISNWASKKTNDDLVT